MKGAGVMNCLKYYLLTMVLALVVFNETAFSQSKAVETENNFLEFYSKNKTLLDLKSPFASNLENFAEYHDALLKVIEKFEKSKNYEDAYPVEGKMTSIQKQIYLVKYFNFIIGDVFAKNKEDVCFYGGWPSRMFRGKCQAPWKNSNDIELKELGATYDSKYYCGGKKLFRCNPLLFGPGADLKGNCIKFENVAEISTKCFDKSRDQVGKIYEAFNSNADFKKNYLDTVSAMKKFCNGYLSYPACKTLTLQEEKIENYSCAQQSYQNQTTASAPIDTLTADVGEIAVKVQGQPTVSPVIFRPERKVAETPDDSKSSNSAGLCVHFNNFIKEGVPVLALKQALTYYKNRKSDFENDQYISIADYSKNSTNKRFFLLNLQTGEVESEKVSHGSGLVDGKYYGDQDHSGNLEQCTHDDETRKNMTRPGFYKIEEPYISIIHVSKWPAIDSTQNNGMRMVGLSKTNEDALGSGVVMHEAPYNNDGDAVMGRSFGCPAFVPGKGAPLMKKMRGGSLFYAYAPVCQDEMKTVLKDQEVKDWENICAN
jgi:hypothetical protein